MTNTVNFVFCVHNHQPVDNFEHIFTKSYEDAYKPFIDVLDRFPEIKFVAHYSGCLLEWLQENRLELFIKIRKLIDAGRLELLGGGFYEPIFTMLSEEDLAGQIQFMNEYLNKYFSVEPNGAWIPERVWEQQLASRLADLSVNYTVLDDFHFKATGLSDSKISSYFVTEDKGKLLTLFPIKEDLRYSIPFKDPQWTIDYLKSYATPDGNNVIVYADDGEKFGIWPNTKKHVYEDGWLEKFLALLTENSECIKTITFGEAVSKLRSAGKIYLPSYSYREMGEWAMLSEGEDAFEGLQTHLKNTCRFESFKQFLPGGFWRNFKVKYVEAALMYGRMMTVGKVVNAIGKNTQSYKSAVTELYKAQCNCAYWHGVFGGIYLPHLRNSVYTHLINAENIVEQESRNDTSTPAYKVFDIYFDGNKEIRLYNDKLNIFITPENGGHIFELDVRDLALNLTAAISRRKEPYHEKLANISQRSNTVDTIHNITQAKEEGLDRVLCYDRYKREKLTDHFFQPNVSIDDVSSSLYEEQGDFVDGSYTANITKKGNIVSVLMKRNGIVRTPLPNSLHIEKDVTIRNGCEFSVSYMLKNSDASTIETVFGVEFVVSMIARESYYYYGDKIQLGSVLAKGDFEVDKNIWVCDSWHNINIGLIFSRPANVWVFPINTVSQSEEGFESIYQGSVIIPRWSVILEPKEVVNFIITQKISKS